MFNLSRIYIYALTLLLALTAFPKFAVAESTQPEWELAEEEETRQQKLQRTLTIVGITTAALVLGAKGVKVTFSKLLLPQSNNNPSKLRSYSNHRLMQTTKRLVELNPKFQGYELVESVQKIKGRHTQFASVFPPKAARPNNGCIIYFPGRNTYYQTRLDELVLLSERTGMPIVAVNYPKRLRSSSEVFDWSTRFSANILEQYDASQSIIMGQSMGGAVATYTAVNLRDQGKLVSLLTDRSFASLSKAGEQKTPFSKSWAYRILKWVGWEMEPEKIIHKIPEANQAHFYSGKDKYIKKAGNTKTYRKLSQKFDVFSVQLLTPETKTVNSHNEKLYEFVLKDHHGQHADVISAMAQVIRKMVQQK